MPTLLITGFDMAVSYSKVYFSKLAGLLCGKHYKDKSSSQLKYEENGVEVNKSL